MGIRGFTSFVDSNTQLLQDYKLHDTRVVIDGNNFYHFLYQYLHVKHQYGGDYDIYYKKVRDIFQMFVDCNIKPFVVFDGGYEVDGKKLKTILARAKNRLYLAGHISHGGRGQILPILAEEVFKNVLIDMEVPFVVCDFEADAELVKLANQWQCPVMSNDSDFFVFNLKGGFVLFDYVDFRLSTSTEFHTDKTYFFLSAQLYHMDNFVNMFPSFNKHLFPIIAILLGNDFIESALFENFFLNLRLIGSKSLPQRHRRIISIINWLESYSSCKEAIEQILTSLDKSSREDVRLHINKCISFYTEFEDTFSLFDYFDGDKTTALQQHTDSVRMYNGGAPPTWFLSAHRSGSLHPFLLNTAASHRVILLSQVENMRAISAYTTSEGIRQVMFGLLLKDDQSPQTGSKGPSQATHVLEYTRDEYKNLKKMFLEPVYSLANYGDLPSLADVADVSRDQCMKILLEALSVPRSLIDKFTPSMQLLMCVVVYWVVHSEPKVLKQHYQALLVSVILLQTKLRIREVKKKDKETSSESDLQESESPTKGCTNILKGQISVRSACEDATEKELSSALQRLDKYHGKFMPITNTNPVESSITHGTSQFQACLYDTLNFNKLLQEPFLSPKPHSFFSGVFLYNFIKELKTRSKPELYISEVLGTKSPLWTVYMQMETALSEHIADDAFQEMVSGKKNSKKKGRKKKAKTSSKSTKNDSDSSDDLPEMVQAACDLDNRFSCLLLEDV